MTLLTYEGRTVSADKLRSMVQQLVKEASNILWRDLLFTDSEIDKVDPNLAGVNEFLSIHNHSTDGAFLSMHEEKRRLAGVDFVYGRLCRNKQASKRLLLEQSSNDTCTEIHACTCTGTCSASGGTRLSLRLLDGGLRSYNQCIESFSNCYLF